jgi:hypothetical protein
MQEGKEFWFPAKRYGWGWGLPATWQGWAVLATYIFALLLEAGLLRPRLHALGFALAVAASTALFVAVCWIKGETPAWRWGDD